MPKLNKLGQNFYQVQKVLLLINLPQNEKTETVSNFNIIVTK